MIGYVTVGTNDLERAVAFYDEVFAIIGAGRFMEEDSFVAWAASPDKPGFGATCCRSLQHSSWRWQKAL